MSYDVWAPKITSVPRVGDIGGPARRRTIYRVDFGPLTISRTNCNGRFATEFGKMDWPAGNTGGALGGGVTGWFNIFGKELGHGTLVARTGKSMTGVTVVAD